VSSSTADRETAARRSAGGRTTGSRLYPGRDGKPEWVAG